MGDTRRMALIFGCLTAAGIIANFFLPWFDDPQAYADDYGIAGIFDMMMSGIRWMTAVFAVLTAALFHVSKRVEPAKEA